MNRPDVFGLPCGCIDDHGILYLCPMHYGWQLEIEFDEQEQESCEMAMEREREREVCAGGASMKTSDYFDMVTDLTRCQAVVRRMSSVKSETIELLQRAESLQRLFSDNNETIPADAREWLDDVQREAYGASILLREAARNLLEFSNATIDLPGALMASIEEEGN